MAGSLHNVCDVVHHVVGAERLPVVPGHPAAQLERPHRRRRSWPRPTAPDPAPADTGCALRSGRTTGCTTRSRGRSPDSGSRTPGNRFSSLPWVNTPSVNVPPFTGVPPASAAAALAVPPPDGEDPPELLLPPHAASRPELPSAVMLAAPTRNPRRERFFRSASAARASRSRFVSCSSRRVIALP